MSDRIIYRLTREKERKKAKQTKSPQHNVYSIYLRKCCWPQKLRLLLYSNKKILLFKVKAEEIILEKHLINCEKEREKLNEKCVSYRKDLDILEEQLR